MNPRIRRWLISPAGTGDRWLFWLLLALVLFVVTFSAYATDVFTISGGVVWIPGHAALIGIIAACLIGYASGGVGPAWFVSFAALLGYRADHAFLGLPHRSISYQFGYFLDPEGWFVLAIESLIIVLLPYIGGTLLRWGVETIRSNSGSSSSG